ncbi:hypothetical protein PBI_DEWDROP_43 [Microbacterium phage Dewdrop]|nr:hypothetical protein PBI_LEAF_43 [Microbacterium phage Leaf]QGZ17412.1 hypothetical protein PBI_DEWDROP_43 [Microbacterium phage Dewdrop]
MELMAEERYKRTWLAADGETWIEQQAQIIGFRAVTGAHVFETDEQGELRYPEVRETLEKQLKAQVSGWFAVHAPEEAEPVREPVASWSRDMVSWVPDSVDQDGNPIPYFEPYPVAVCTAEQAYYLGTPQEPSAIENTTTEESA